MTSIGLAVSPPNTEERAVFTQLKPVRMSNTDGAEDSSVFEDVKPTVRNTSLKKPGLTHRMVNKHSVNNKYSRTALYLYFI